MQRYLISNVGMARPRVEEAPWVFYYAILLLFSVLSISASAAPSHGLRWGERGVQSDFCPQGSLTKKNDGKYLAVAPTFASGGFYANAVGFMSRQFPEGPADHKSVADVIETSESIWVVALASVRDAIKHEIVGGVIYTFQCRHKCHPPSAFINFIAVSEPKHGAFIDEHPP